MLTKQIPNVAVSTVIFALNPSDELTRAQKLLIPLVLRTRQPYKNQWALPGGPLRMTESLIDCAKRNLQDTTQLTPKYLEQLFTFGNIQRGSDQRIISITYWALVKINQTDLLNKVQNVQWFEADILKQNVKMAFDHNKIVDYALWRLRNKTEYGAVAINFLSKEFTLKQLREVYEIVLNKKLDPANFRRQITLNANIEPTQYYAQGNQHRPARLYTYNTLTEPSL